MINVVVNSQVHRVLENSNLLMTLQLIAESQSLDLSNIAVALNQHVVPKSQWAETFCQQGDQIDLFNAVAGG
ncbi:sulfur carrier protein ThiS [Paraglaciecola marina]|uniref:sulfur carrier protein ThiS n=1 Tax=Paraglaciecola marina TaxID=2500157 RepID=UPI00105F4526|nr:sulfur carrier protein ThiS [Paraglaciecola marina]